MEVSGKELSAEVVQLLSTEEQTLAGTRESIDQQLRERATKLRRERERARTLTGEMIATRRDEERAQLASDEAVAHAMVTKHDEEAAALESLVDRPYFARVELLEEQPTGGTRTVEYKIGYAANAACRIIDWRKAPLSRLYYEYREGDEYCEEIQGKERVGTVQVRHQVEISRGVLTKVSCRFGTFEHRGDLGWGPVGSSGRAAPGRDFGALPDILSLISPEQFSAITRDASSAVLIQGVAGSGKTTVALHRLAWLLAPDNGTDQERVTPQDCVVLTLGSSLRDYVRTSLAGLGIREVPVLSYREWCSKQISRFLPDLCVDSTGGVVFTSHSDRPSHTVERVKRSIGVLKALEETARTAQGKFQDDPIALLLDVLDNSALVKRHDESRLLGDAALVAARDRTRALRTRGTLDRSDYSLLLRALQLLKGRGAVLGRRDPYKHLVVDEVQDYSPVELATVLSVVNDTGNITLVGDTNQRMQEGFPGWEKLRRWWTSRKISSSFIRLEVSHRSTREIVRCAAALGKLDPPPGGRAGDRPRWLFARTQERALGGVLAWLQERVREAPNGLIGVVCCSAAQCKEASALLQPSFGPLVRIGDESGFSFDAGIVVCDTFTAKGLEFYGVLVWEPVSSALSAGDVGRNQLYVASSRAQSFLAYVTWGGASTPLREISRNLLQRVDLDLDFDDAEAEERANASESVRLD